jgi:hypothetical protein
MPNLLKRTVELLALAVTLVAGFLYFEERGRLWLFWVLAALAVLTVAGWQARRNLRRWVRALLSRLR